MSRATASVIVPFGGAPSELDELLEGLETLVVSDADEILIVDNSLGQDVAARRTLPARARLLRAPYERSSYYARNVGAAAAAGEWLWFMDADCRPAPGTLDAFFARPIDAATGAIAGEIIGMPEQESLTARYSRWRRYLNQQDAVNDPRRPFAATANVLVRRAAWEQVGGFCEGIRSGGDREFCWRLQAAGWRLGYVGEALVEHRHRTTLRALVRLRARYGACAAWLVRHDDVPFMRPRPYWLARHLAVAAVHAGRGRRESAVFHLLDAVMFLTWCAGYLLENRSPAIRAPGADPQVIVVLDEFPDERRGWTGEAVRAASPPRLRIEARRRASRPLPWTLRDLDIRYAEDDGFLASARERLRLLATRPAMRIPRDEAAREARIADADARVLRRPASPAQLSS